MCKKLQVLQYNGLLAENGLIKGVKSGK